MTRYWNNIIDLVVDNMIGNRNQNHRTINPMYEKIKILNLYKSFNN